MGFEWRKWLGWWAVAVCGLCAILPFDASANRVSGRRARIVDRAQDYVGLPSLRHATKRFPDDCAGFVRASYESNGLAVLPLHSKRGENAVTAIHRRARQVGALRDKRPRPGDLVFFRETYDRNRDGRRNDGLTHVGIVESIAKDGTVTFLHRGSKGIVRARLNPHRPRARTAADGAVLNDYIRAKDSRGRGYLAGELFAGYASADAFRPPRR